MIGSRWMTADECNAICRQQCDRRISGEPLYNWTISDPCRNVGFHFKWIASVSILYYTFKSRKILNDPCARRLVFEHESWVYIEWRWEIGIAQSLICLMDHSTKEISYTVAGLISIYVICLSCMYSLGPTLYRMSNATFLSMSLMTSNFYSLLASLVFLDAQVMWTRYNGGRVELTHKRGL